MNIAARYRNLPVKHKLRLLIGPAVSSALILAFAAVLVYDQLAARDALRNDLGILTEIFSANSTATLTFNDASAADELLATLRVKRHVVAAFLYTANGTLFARYDRAREPRRLSPPVLADDSSRFEAGRLVLFRSVQLNGKRIGTVCLESDIEALRSRLQRSAGSVAVDLPRAS